jgi:hypothetical protein
MKTSAEEVNQAAFEAVACSQAAKKPEIMLRAQTLYGAYDAAQKQRVQFDWAATQEALNRASSQYHDRIERASGRDVLAGTSFGSFKKWTDAAAAVLGMVPHPAIKAYIGPALSGGIRGFEALYRVGFGSTAQAWSQLGVLNENRRFQAACKTTMEGVFGTASRDNDFARLFTVTMADLNFTADPRASAVDNLRLNPGDVDAHTVLSLIARDGTLGAQNPDKLRPDTVRVHDSMLEITEKLSSDVDRLADGYSSLKAAVDRVEKGAGERQRQQEQARAEASIAQDQVQLQSLRIEAARSTVFLVSTLVGGEAGETIQRAGNVAVTIAQSVLQYRDTLATIGKLASGVGAMATVAFGHVTK